MDLADARRIVHYDPVTGQLSLAENRGSRKAGNTCGSLKSNGYVYVSWDKRTVQAHRFIWFWMTGEWPKSCIDHVNCVKTDNRWSNLREATYTQNHYNRPVRRDSRTGAKGIGFIAHANMYRAKLKANGRIVQLGYFKTLDEAKQAYAEAVAIHHGEFARAA